MKQWISAIVIVMSLAGCSCLPDVSGVLQLTYAGIDPIEISCSATVVGQREGYIYALTCHHAILLGQKARDMYVDGQLAELVLAAPEDDLALLRFKTTTKYHAYRVADPVLGETIWAVGYADTWTICEQRLRLRHVQGGNVSFIHEDAIGHSAALWYGHSGGALLNAGGQLVGINQSGRQCSDDFSVAIPPDRIRRILRDAGL